MFGFKRRKIQKALPPITAKHEHDLGCALLDAFRGMAAAQQVCLHCGARGGFEMRHHQNCIIRAAADRLFHLAVWNQATGTYLTFEEHRGEIRRMRVKIQSMCDHTARQHREGGGWWCPDCYAADSTSTPLT